MSINDLVVRHIPDFGYLPILKINGEEVFRGELQTSSQIALLEAFAIYQEQYKGGRE